jgi:hypothetical protein
MIPDRYNARRAAEYRYPHRVDIPVPPLRMSGGLNEMHA